jgi:HEAT repeat protein
MKRNKKKKAKDSEFTLNEPVKPIPGGRKRESIRVDPKEFPAIERRLRLNRLLLIHDPEEVEERIAQIEEKDLPVLRQIAQESILSGNEPTVRRNAIKVIGRFITPENLNLLTNLARFGEDPYVRGSALTSLAQSGIALALPVLKEGLAAHDPIEYRRAQLGLLHLGEKLGIKRINELQVRERRKKVLMRLKAIVHELKRKEIPPKMLKPHKTAED